MMMMLLPHVITVYCLSNAIQCMGQNIKSLAACICVCVCVYLKTVLCGEKCAHMMTLWGMSDLWGIFPFPTRNSSSSPRIKKF